MLIQPAHDRAEVDATLAQFGEDARPQRLKIVPSLLTRAPRELPVIVLEMDIPDAVGPAIHRLDHRRSLVTSAEQVMSGVEDDTQHLRVGLGQKAIGLSRRLYPSSGV